MSEDDMVKRNQQPRPRTGLVEDASDEERAIGKRVSEFRDKSGLTNATLGETLGVGQDTIKKITQGLTVTQWVKLARLSEALDVTPNDVLGYPSNRDRNHEVLTDVLAASYVGLGLQSEEATRLAHIVLRVFEEPEALAVVQDRRLSARIQAELASRPFRRERDKG